MYALIRFVATEWELESYYKKVWYICKKAVVLRFVDNSYFHHASITIHVIFSVLFRFAFLCISNYFFLVSNPDLSSFFLFIFSVTVTHFLASNNSWTATKGHICSGNNDTPCNFFNPTWIYFFRNLELFFLSMNSRLEFIFFLLILQS